MSNRLDEILENGESSNRDPGTDFTDTQSSERRWKKNHHAWACPDCEKTSRKKFDKCPSVAMSLVLSWYIAGFS